MDIDILDLSPATVGMFDVVLCLGVLYHMRHPLLALEKLRAVTRELLIIETAVDLEGHRRPGMIFYPQRELNNDPTNWWGPNSRAITAMLEDVGFGRVRRVDRPPRAPYRAARALWHWSRGKNTLRNAFRQDRAAFHAYCA
jgi:tRNA (mo5U34)-methyltransferase